jgi:RNA polymerase sigma-70 factor, ECF subfamily
MGWFYLLSAGVGSLDATRSILSFVFLRDFFYRRCIRPAKINGPEMLPMSFNIIDHALPGVELPQDRGQAALRQMQAGETAGLEVFFAVLGPPLMGVAWRMLGSREEAEEALQDLLVKCWNKSGTYDAARGRPYTWAVTILRGLCLDRLRKAGRRIRLEAMPEGLEPVAPRGAQAGDRPDLAAALHLLTAREWQAVEMAVFGDLTHPEIAGELGEPLGTVKSRIRRALQKLHHFLNEEPPTP